MKKLFIAAVAITLPSLIMAQTAFDTYQMSRYDLRGTARYMSMGGAFGALGGDLSSLNNNPAGIGVYRKSEVGATLNIDIQSAKSQSPTESSTVNQTKAYCNNVGYVGSLYTGSEVMPYFQWGVSYGRVASFDRHYRGGNGAMNGSLSNYIAGYTSAEQWTGSELTGTDGNYFNYSAPWLSMLAYNSFMINSPSGSTAYSGLWQQGSAGYSSFDVLEKGYVDEYAINFGGNFSDLVYWGIGFGITDIEYSQNTYYTEDLTGASIPNQRAATLADASSDIVDGQVVDGVKTGDGGFGLESIKRISGSGFNFKAGVIIRPINELRFGLAVHTPTYYNLSQSAIGTVDYGYGYSNGPAAASYTGSPTDYVDFKIRTPWRLMGSVAGVIGSKAIISAEYEYRPYQSMATKDSQGYEYRILNNDVKDYYKAANIIRLGAEYRLNNHVSARLGYAYESTPTTSKIENSEIMMYTSNPDDTGMTPSYSLDNSARYITAGLGYHIGGFYLDAAYVNKHRESTFHPYTSNSYTATPEASTITQNSNNIVLSIGYKF